MLPKSLNKLLSVLVAVAMATSICLPTAAFASEQVSVEDHVWSSMQAKLVSELTIDDVDAPELGSPLDDRAVVSTAEGETWEIPVLWIGSDLQLATEPVEGITYLPALAFFVPTDYAIQGVDETGKYTVTLSDELTKLFGGTEIISVYDAATGITYILPASLRDFFSQRSQAEATQAEEPASDQPAEEAAAPRSILDIYCAQTARDALTDEELEYLLDLILNRLQPQAVELLLNSFPAFREAADKGLIGTQIGLYVYFLNGDKDGIASHEAAIEDALAYVQGDATEFDDGIRFAYMIGIDASSLVKKDANKNFVIDPKTGKYIIDRAGEAMVTFRNTIVHELFHALMDDYNRTGMIGGTNIMDVYTGDSDKFASEELAARYKATRYPTWFIEGTASSVENVYAFRYDTFQDFGLVPGAEGIGGVFLPNTVLYNYVNGASKGTCFDLAFAAGDLTVNGVRAETTSSRYVTGYLAVLYLSELAAERAGKTAVQTADGKTTFSSETLRMGMNTILKRMHDGETLDAVIKDISPVRDGKKVFTSTADFEAKFIKGEPVTENGNTSYSGDRGTGGSLEFVTALLRYLEAITNADGRTYRANGSILMDFEADVDSPLDPTKTATSDYLKVVESNQMVESTVPDSEALKGGGKSRSGADSSSAGTSLTAGSLPVAAKTVSKQVETDGAVAGDQVVAEPEDAAAVEVDEPVEAADQQANEPEPEVVAEPEGEPAIEPISEQQPVALVPDESENNENAE